MQLWQVGWIRSTCVMNQRLLIRSPSEMQDTTMMGRSHPTRRARKGWPAVDGAVGGYAAYKQLRCKHAYSSPGGEDSYEKCNKGKRVSSSIRPSAPGSTAG